MLKIREKIKIVKSKLFSISAILSNSHAFSQQLNSWLIRPEYSKLLLGLERPAYDTPD
jgi:hypothetical protein